jgi:hypothetical protein
LTKEGECLSKAPGQVQQQFEAIYGNNTLPGQIFSVDEQCKFIWSSKSFFCKG